MFSLSIMEDRTGIKVSVKIKAPSRAKPRVKANGVNILPSTFWKEKIGRSAVMMMSFEKNTDLALPRAVVRIIPALLRLLNASMPISRACDESATNNASTITTAPSMMMPKSMAPIDSRLALMPPRCRQMKAKSSAKGMTLATMTVHRQSRMKRNTTNVTSRMPSNTLCRTVCTLRRTKSSRS